MPAAIYNKTLDKIFYDELIPLGYTAEDGSKYLYNHMDITVTLDIDWTEDGDELYQVVGFQVEPKSLHYDQEMIKFLYPDKPSEWESPTPDDLDEINQFRYNLERSEQDGDEESIQWGKEKFGAWLGP